MTVNTTLRRMPAEVLGTWLEYHSAEYVKERVAAGDAPDYAERRAAESNAEYFPGGVPAEGQHIFQVVDGESVVGTLWVGSFSPDRSHEWWVFDIEIVEEQRGKGYGRAAMQLAELEARGHGATKLGLNVFGHNAVAQRLYASLGYTPTAINMANQL